MCRLSLAFCLTLFVLATLTESKPSGHDHSHGGHNHQHEPHDHRCPPPPPCSCDGTNQEVPNNQVEGNHVADSSSSSEESGETGHVHGTDHSQHGHHHHRCPPPPPCQCPNNA